MGRYIGWVDDVVARYPRVYDVGSTSITSIDLSLEPPLVNPESAYIYYAESHIEQELAAGFTVPFSSNNVTARDLMIDHAFYLTQVYRDDDAAREVLNRINSKIERLLDGSAAMMTTSGEAIYQSGASGAIYSTTEDYHPVFGMGDWRGFVVDSSQIEDEADARR